MPRKCVAYHSKNKSPVICHRPICKDCPKLLEILDLWEKYPDICKSSGINEEWIVKIGNLVNFG